MKEVSAMRRQDGAKQRTVLIPKLDDANHAGGPQGKDCTLILTEGDSAKALAVSGLGVVGRDTFGVFPLRGKLLNVREASQKQVRIVLLAGLHRFGCLHECLWLTHTMLGAGDGQRRDYGTEKDPGLADWQTL
jgi:hypothetical protein